MPSTSRASFWADLVNRRDLISAVSGDRWAHDGFLHPHKSSPGSAYTFKAGSVGDVSLFDNEFFGISPREAAQMDPQQRLLLELSWEAFEDAGIKPSAMRGSRCGVYIGIASADYSYRLAEDMSSIDSAVATGNTASIAANRLSYFYDLNGPSMALDTACSSSLVAFHQACQAIRSGEVTHALAGGISLHLHPYGFIIFSKASMLSPLGHCNVFDESGDGYVRSEGGGVFVLKDYDAALADGDQILAVVRHSAVNTDGRKSGLTIPKPEAQAQLLDEAYTAAGIRPDDISYIEAHGTGTSVGDPIETLALGNSLGKKRRIDNPLPIGSIKSNMGHLEAASGVAGMVKALHVLRHRQIPATIGITRLNPRIDFHGLNLQVVTDTVNLAGTDPLIVGVNSFGFGGANAHVILSSPQVGLAAGVGLACKTASSAPIPLVLTGATEPALRAAAADLAAYLSQPDHAPLYDVAFQLAHRRDWFEHRAVLFAMNDPAALAFASVGNTWAASSARGASDQLQRFADNEDDADESIAASGVEAPCVSSGLSLAQGQGPAFFYAGNGSQWEGMGRRLLSDPIFVRAIDEIDQTFIGLAGYSIRDQLEGGRGTERYQHTDVAQPALFAVQVGVTQILRGLGVHPVATCGHSVGEIAAVWAAGALDLADAVRVIYHRSRLQETTKGLGNMTAVATDTQTARRLLAEAGLVQHVCIAGFNSHRGLTLAGDAAHLSTVESVLSSERIGYKRLDLDYAFHSAAMDGIEVDLRAALADLRPRATVIPFYSGVTGTQIDGKCLDAAYWWKNIRQPVQFESAVNQALAAGWNVLVEIGSHPVLKGYLNDCLKDAGLAGTTITTLSRQNDTVGALRQAVASTLIASETAVDLQAYFPVAGPHTALPHYPWQKERHWHTVTAESPDTLNRQTVHPLLGYRLAQHEWTWEQRLDPQKQAFLADHVVGHGVVFPGTGFAELALAAAHAWHAEGITQLEDLEIHAPINFHAQHGKMLRVAIDIEDGRVTIKSRDILSAEQWTVNAKCRIIVEAKFPQQFGPERASGLNQAETGAEAEANFKAAAAANSKAESDTPTPLGLSAGAISSRIPDFTEATHHALTRQVGLQYGPAFRAIRHGWSTENSVTALFDIPASITEGLTQFHIHPALLDCAFQLIIQILRDRLDLSQGIAFVPTQVGRISLHQGMGAPHAAQARLLRQQPHSLLVEFTLFDDAGRTIALIENARFKRIRLHHGHDSHIQHLHTHLVPQPSGVDARSALVSFDVVLQAANNAAQRNGIDHNYRAYVDELDPLLEALTSRFTYETLSSFNQRSDLEAHLSDLAAATPAIAPYLRNLVALAEQDGLLSRPNGRLDFVKMDADGDSSTALDIWNTLYADYPDFSGIVRCVGRVGNALHQILAGEVAIESILSRTQGPAQLTDELFGNCAQARLANLVNESLQDARRRMTAADRLGILEVGGNGPILAAHLAATLNPTQDDLIFARATLSGLDSVADLLESYPAVLLDVFDPDAIQHTETNGGTIVAGDSRVTAPENYQVDIAIVWINFSTDADNTCACDYALRHLKPGGTLLVIGQHRTNWLDFAFGARPAWWGPQTTASQPSPQRTRSMWASRLSTMGLESVQYTTATRDANSGPFLLMSRRPELNRSGHVAAANTLPRSWLLVADAAGPSARLADVLARALQLQGGLATVSIHGDVIAITQQLIAIKDAFGELDGIIHLRGLGAGNSGGDIAGASERCMVAANILQACGTTQTTAPITVMTCGAYALGHGASGAMATADSIVAGFARTLMNEVSANRVRCLDMDTATPDPDLVLDLVNDLIAASAENEVAFTTGGGRFVPRVQLGHATLPVPAAQHRADNIADNQTASAAVGNNLQLNFSQPGQLRNMQWQIAPRPALANDEVEVSMRATGLNFRDVMYALGLLSDEAIENGFAGATLGLEFSGKISRVGADVTELAVGDRVVGFGSACFANWVVTKASSVSYIPSRLSYEAAATIPSTFLTSYYALCHLGRLEKGEKVLIHGAAGGVGLAAIQIARWCGAEVFATAGSDEKRDFLRMIGVDHVLDSRTLAFADDIMSLTGGQGVDVVLNSLAGEAINRNLSVLKPFGRFLELGKRDFYENTRIGLRPFRNNITYFGIDADQLMNERPGLTRVLFGEVIALFEQGVLHPLPYTGFEARDVIHAFRFMQQAQQIGKIVVTYRNEIPVSDQPQTLVSQQQVLALRPEATYLVTGGLGGFGLRTAQWLVEKGARHLVLMGRRGVVTDEARQLIHAMQALGVRIDTYACDVTDQAQLAQVLTPWLSSLKGIVHAAAVIEDSLVSNLTAEQLNRVLAPKVTGAHNLHALTAGLDLDFFVLYSSATTLFGNPGQAAYVAANSGLEALANQRRAVGLPATCMLWGAIDDVGFLARNTQVKDALQHRMGGRALMSTEALNQLQEALLYGRNNEAVLELDWKALSRFLPSAQSPRFCELARQTPDAGHQEDSSEDIAHMLAKLDDNALRAAFIEMIKAELGQILRLATDKIDANKSIYDMGLDSLMGVELVVALEARFGIRLPVMALSENPTIEKLTEKLIGLLRAQSDAGTAQGPAAQQADQYSTTAQVTELARQHASEITTDEIATLVQWVDTESAQASGTILQ